MLRLFLATILFLLKSNSARKTYYSSSNRPVLNCKPQIGTVNCQIFCRYCYSEHHNLKRENEVSNNDRASSSAYYRKNHEFLNKDPGLTLKQKMAKEFNCDVRGQINGVVVTQMDWCQCEKLTYCENMVGKGAFRPAMSEAENLDGRTIIILDESSSISNKIKLKTSHHNKNQKSKLHDKYSQFKNFVVSSYNSWLDGYRHKKNSKINYVHDKLTLIKYNEKLSIQHSNNKTLAKNLDLTCSYNPQKKAKFRDALGCTLLLHRNECNNKLVIFSDGENDGVKFNDNNGSGNHEISKVWNDRKDKHTRQLYEMIQDVRTRGWQIHYISTYAWNEKVGVMQAPLHLYLRDLLKNQEKSRVFAVDRSQEKIEYWNYHHMDASTELISFFDTEKWDNYYLWNIAMTPRSMPNITILGYQGMKDALQEIDLVDHAIN